MTKSEIIVQLEDLARDAKGRIDPTDPEDIFRRDYEALTEAVEILKGGAPVEYGKWVPEEIQSISTRNRLIKYKVYSCSICGVKNGKVRKKYCPNCGAKMDLEE